MSTVVGLCGNVYCCGYQEQKQAEEGSEYKSAAWKAYMEEVKAIQARSCTDQEGHKRPLVK